MLFPHGIFMIFAKDFCKLWMLKAMRIRDLAQYISNQNMKAIINLMVSYKQKQALDDENLKYSMVEDSNYISERI